LRVSVTVLLSCGVAVAHADVTITQQTSMDVASLVHTHGSSTLAFATDKKREDTETHCEGMMSMVCGNVQSGEIVRLDRGLSWRLEPKQKRYREQPFATPEQLAAMREQMNADLEKMKSCPAAQRQQPDKSKCEMSPPKFEVKKTGEKATIAGHETERTQGTMTSSCTNRDTGEVCDTVVALDVWLTQDSLPGISDRHNFEMAYAKKLGLDDPHGVLKGQMAQYFASYQTQLTELAQKAKDFKGQPLKTRFRVLMGGAQCHSAQQDTPAAGSNPSANQAIANVANAGKAMGQLVGGFFKKKKADDSAATADTGGAASAASAAPPTATSEFPQMTQLVAFTVETTDIKSDPIPASQFEIPSDWTKDVPREAKNTKDSFTCPKGGT
jgi:hypothetical protein